jgi:hypothetical protein
MGQKGALFVCKPIKAIAGSAALGVKAQLALQ